MHQHPRRSPVTASPASSPRTNPTRTNNPRDSEHSAGTAENTDAMMRAPEGTSSGDANDPVKKLNQIVQNYFTKAALTILNARTPLPHAYTKDGKTQRVNKWFNVEIDETDALRDHLRTWRSCDAVDNRPPPMVIETFIDVQDLASGQSLVLIDDYGKKWDVEEALNASTGSTGEVILERWIIQLGGQAVLDSPQNLAALLPRVYKNSIVLFRSLFASARLFAAWKMSKRGFAARSAATTPRLRFRIKQEPTAGHKDHLSVPLCAEDDHVVEQYAFDPIESPAGSFKIHVTYRTSCDFRLENSEAYLSSRFLMEEPYARPKAHRLESAPARRNYMDEDPRTEKPQRPSLVDAGQAYGSLSTFHHLEGRTGTSPISALRTAQYASESPEDKRPSTRSGQGSRSSFRSGDSTVPRRPSVSFTPFKSPSLSASPAQAEQTGTSYPRGSSLGKSSPLAVLAEARHPSGPVPPRGSPKAADHARTPSSSNSPKPGVPHRYSSSFGHRKAKLSTGGGSKTEDDNSSGKASASSAQPGSGVLAEGTTSSGSLHTDDDNISDFLKLLDKQKDLKSFHPSPSSQAPIAESSRRTSAALNKFKGMRESNVQLSESISSSQLLHRSSSSSSRQLASVPPMVAATSISTSSSPGKPISPHTPHTPAIPSRLSANSVADYTRDGRQDSRRRRDWSDAAPPTEHHEGAIDIPTSPSPRPFPSYRRSSSAAQGTRTAPVAVGDESEDPIFPFFMRSASLDVDDRPPPSRGEIPRNHGGSVEPTHEDPSPEPAPQVATAGSLPRRGGGLPYRSAYPHLGNRGSSSSLMERGSHSGSEGRRASGRFSFGRGSRPVSVAAGEAEDDEVLPFAMSDLDEGRVIGLRGAREGRD